MSVMALQGRKSSPQKSRPLESGHRRHAVWIAIEYSYKLGQKSEFKFWCELGWFLQRQSQFVSQNELEIVLIILVCLLFIHAKHHNNLSAGAHNVTGAYAYMAKQLCDSK